MNENAQERSMESCLVGKVRNFGGDLGRELRRGRAIFNQLIRSEPNVADFYIGQGRAYLDLGKFDSAYTNFDKTIELEPENPFIH